MWIGDPRRPARELEIPRARRVYVNRNLRMEEIELVGFDMDYTLAIYNQPEMERLSIELTLKKMVAKHGYPAEIVDLSFSPEWAIRGLVVDRREGNVFKMDRHGHVGRVFHGSRMLSRDERAALYRKERIHLSAPRYAWIDTLFALPEGVMYLKLTEYFGKRGTRPPRLWDDIRECIDEAHRDDSLKSVVRGDLPRFVVQDSDLGATLHKLRSSGKRLFLLTNSLWDYTDTVMKFILDGKLLAYPSWRSYFDIVIVGGAKPAFFTESNPFFEIDPMTGEALPTTVKGLHRGHVYGAGNLIDFEAMARSRGDKVLYVGDHIYGDILRAKKSSVWRTAMIVQELERELEISERLAVSTKTLDELDRTRRNLDAEIDYQNLILKSLHKLADEGVESADGVPLEQAKREAKRALDDLRLRLRDATAQCELLEEQMDAAFNPFWGPLFKEANENSRFGEQVEDYACLYTGRVSNFLAYSPLRYFRAPRDKMPHEM